jgi:hypothetical protein
MERGTFALALTKQSMSGAIVTAMVGMIMDAMAKR